MVEQNINILTVGFEGIHRSGKGTQISLLEQRFKDSNVGVVQLRGDGSRSASGDRIGNSISKWWDNHRSRFEVEGKRMEWWNLGADRLARELVVWRKRLIKDYLESKGYEQGLIILDRSIISRALVLISGGEIQEGQVLTPNNLYSSRVNANKVTPDIIFELFAPKSIVEERLNAGEGDNFKKKGVIEREFETYYRIKNYFDMPIRRKIVSVDSSQSPSSIHDFVFETIKERFPRFIDNSLLKK